MRDLTVEELGHVYGAGGDGRRDSDRRKGRGSRKSRKSRRSRKSRKSRRSRDT